MRAARFSEEIRYATLAPSRHQASLWTLLGGARFTPRLITRPPDPTRPTALALIGCPRRQGKDNHSDSHCERQEKPEDEQKGEVSLQAGTIFQMGGMKWREEAN